MNVDLHSLSGAYVLHAVSDGERLAFGRHLVKCGPCADEMAGLLETAARLGLAATATPPAQLRAAVLAAIGSVRQVRPNRVHFRRPGRGTPARPATGAG